MNGRRVKQLKRNLGLQGMSITAQYQDKIIPLTRAKLMVARTKDENAPTYSVQNIMLHGTRLRLKNAKKEHKAQARMGIRATTRTEGLNPKQMYNHSGRKKTIVPVDQAIPVEKYEV